jgi:hypothetical protein
MFPPPSPRAFPDHPLTNVTVALLGGALVTGFMLRLFRRLSERDAPRSFSVICKASLYGMLATLLTVEIFDVLVSLFATSWFASMRGPQE